jgi:hypothetical protein
MSGDKVASVGALSSTDRLTPVRSWGDIKKTYVELSRKKVLPQTKTQDFSLNNCSSDIDPGSSSAIVLRIDNDWLIADTDFLIHR